jgi:hypothetical protein
MDIDKSKIPEPLLSEMLELWGEEGTIKAIRKAKYNYKHLTWMVTDYRFKKKYGVRLYPIFVVTGILILILIFIYRF